MGPNVRRLFEYKRLTGIKQELKDCATYFKRKQLFEAHGEALIEALEKLANEADGFSGLAGPVIVGHTNMKVLKDRAVLFIIRTVTSATILLGTWKCWSVKENILIGTERR